MEFGESVDRLVLGDQILLLRRIYAGLSGNCLKSEDVLFEKALLVQFLQVPSEHPTMDGLVPFAVMVGQYSSNSGSEGSCWISFGRLPMIDSCWC